MQTVLNKLYLFFLLAISPSLLHAQLLGGGSSFSLFDLPPSSRMAALGGYNTSLLTDDPSSFVQNPALLADTTSGLFAASYNNLFNNISHFNAAYNAGLFKGNGGIQLRVINYGNMTETDAGGNTIGTFSPSEYVLTTGFAKQQGNFRLGVNAKFAGSQIAGYNSHWLGVDIGALSVHPKKNLTVGLSARNIGFVLDKYTTGAQVSAPLDIMLGMTYKLDHAPLRLSVTSHNWQRWDITYLDPNKTGKLDANGQEIKEKKSFYDNFSRHFVIGAELLFSKNFQARIAFNQLMNRELKLENAVQGAGISFGFMLRVKAIEISFSRATWSAAGSTNSIGIMLDLQKMGVKSGISTQKRDNTRS